MVNRQRSQALLEFAIVAPVLFLIVLISFDFGRGAFAYAQLQGAAREAARQAILAYDQGSNTAQPGCTQLTPPCPSRAVVDYTHLLDSVGYSTAYADSTSVTAPPSYGTYTANADPSLPGTIALTSGDQVNTVYVFIYELDATPGNPSPRWPCLTTACTSLYGNVVRTGGRQQVVVDLKMRWQPVALSIAGLKSYITFDATTVETMEF